MLHLLDRLEESNAKMTEAVGLLEVAGARLSEVLTLLVQEKRYGFEDAPAPDIGTVPVRVKREA
jgi:hypothetical protein